MRREKLTSRQSRQVQIMLQNHLYDEVERWRERQHIETMSSALKALIQAGLYGKEPPQWIAAFEEMAAEEGKTPARFLASIRRVMKRIEEQA